jgi:hypothetical protein
MSDDKLVTPKQEFPPASLPTIYADGIVNLAHSGSLARFYLMRTDPSLDGSERYQVQAFAQVVMPLLALVQTAVFLEIEVKRLVSRGLVDQKFVDEARRVLGTPSEKT